MRNHLTTFGALPIGATFGYDMRVKDPTDRRRWVTRRINCTKDRHGSIAGWAGLMRFYHDQIVYIDASDLRLLIACAQHRASQSC